jgi:hypothetical protein
MMWRKSGADYAAIVILSPLFARRQGSSCPVPAEQQEQGFTTTAQITS